MNCSMIHKQSIFNDVPKSKGYDKCSKLEKMLADEIFDQMLTAKSERMVFHLPKGVTGLNVARVLLVKHFPYTCINARWYEVEKHKDGTRDFIINTKIYKKFLERNYEVFAKIENIINKELHITSCTDEAYAVKQIAEYILDHCEYDVDLKYNSQPYDCLIRGCTVCCGYAEGFKALCDYCGIKCQCILGECHQWNRVHVNGHWLNVDITWVDTGSSKAKYFFTNDAVFYSSHIPMIKKMAQYWEFKG